MSGELIVVDCETTGLDPASDRVVEVAWCWAKDPRRCASRLVDPGIPIPAEASAVHHLTDRDVVWAPCLQEVVEELLAEAGPGAVWIAHNSRFDSKFLPLPGQWIDTYRCALECWPDAPGHSNQVLRYWLRLHDLPAMRDLPPHRAGHDAVVTCMIHRELSHQMTTARMLEVSSRPALLPTIRFGKHAGQRFADLPRDYLAWMVRQDFDEDVMHTARHWLEGGALAMEGGR